MNKRLDKISDIITEFCGNIKFVILHLIWWTAWIAFGVEVFPYGLLTLVVSLEAIVLSTFILMSQNRETIRDRETSRHDLELDEETNYLLKEVLAIVTSLKYKK